MSIGSGLPKHYLVLKRRGKWCAKSTGRFGDTYTSQATAVSATIEKAVKHVALGREVTVSLFVNGSEPRVVWSSASAAGPTAKNQTNAAYAYAQPRDRPRRSGLNVTHTGA